MKFIKDLGMRLATIDSKRKWHFGLYECQGCLQHFERRIDSVREDTVCSPCANKASAASSKNKAAEEFSSKASGVHKGKYDYSLVNYVSNKVVVTIICPEHGGFLQRPNGHLRGAGCPRCADSEKDISKRTDISNTEPTLLYYVYFPEVKLWKVGCTTKTVYKRFQSEKLKYEVLSVIPYKTGYEAYTIERHILNSTAHYQFTGKVLNSGNTELRISPIEDFQELLNNAKVT